MSRPVFHDSLLSSAAWRVRAALAIKGIETDTRRYEIIGKPHRTAAFMALNPQGTVPVLEIDGLTITQSLSILEYLEETCPGPPLLPKDAEGRARVRTLSYIIAMETHVVTNMDVAMHAAQGDDTRLGAWQNHYFCRGLDAFEALLAHPATGTFCHGDVPGMADCCLVPQMRNVLRIGMDAAQWPRLARIADHAADNPAFAQTHPDQLATTP
ncbi:maleylacetoacetate isomerase [Tritonibacter mobilis]|nr:maleylacetoacetate isomerase [Tritonibacter mobilis]